MSEEKSAELRPEEIAAFCDAVERNERAVANHVYTYQTGGDADKDCALVAQLLPKIRALAAPAAVPVSELEELRLSLLTKRDSLRSNRMMSCIEFAANALHSLIEKHSKGGA